MDEYGIGLGYGHGVMVDSETVVTVAHVAEGANHGTIRVSRASEHHGSLRRILYVRGEVSHPFRMAHSVEHLVVIKLEGALPCKRYPKFRSIEPGDSGSPILGKGGDVVGLVTGYKHNVFFMGKFTPGRTIVGTNGPMGPVPRKPTLESTETE